jgi:VWFA-related protein
MPQNYLAGCTTAEHFSDSSSLSHKDNLMELPLFVCDRNGNFFADLSKEDIRIVENNNPQTIIDFNKTSDQPLLVAFLVDTSTSMANEFQYIRTATRYFFERMLRPNFDRALLIEFANYLWTIQDTTSNVTSLARAAESLRIRETNSTQFYDAMFTTLTDKLQHANGFRRILIVISDGRDEGSTTSYFSLAELLKEMDVTVFVFSLQRKSNDYFGTPIWTSRLDELATQSGGRAFLYYTPRDITVLIKQISQQLNNQYTLIYRSTNSWKGGRFLQIKIDSPRRGLRLFYRKGYLVRETK